ncbi:MULTISPECIES: chromosomal replication initiator protein DnaA [Helicobacter]|uniref:Chromosomal replication initiator protein DnaA n=2 Tax=Helicobacter TaxID=209 RepID=A0A377J2J0_9HELI|nr:MULTISPECIES: chromosomal replication initiator protein DnaA [Helicobacter]MDL0079129.1 chromosomal replication initiator protein DnaA [Helicobacter sp. CPD2-1]MDL0081157.1 chromosomal replication initiator protein DnaA [Helicobacter sp. XJK30-2]STO96660.1 chromosomal replication initiation protein [Helicobacter canis]
MIWDEVLVTLKNEISQYEFSTYISLMKYDENASKSNLAVFMVPNPYIEKWIKSKYTDKIKHIFEIHTKTKTDIKIIVAKDKQNVKNYRQKIQKSQSQTLLNSQQTFDNFVEGNSNKSALIIAKSVAEHQAKSYNPVLLYGHTGLGKTHLLCAIGNAAIEREKNVIYMTTEEFLNEWQKHLKQRTMDTFRDKYRECDYLLIDDVQFLGGKGGLQEEFFNTFEALHKNNKQIVMTSDKLPKQIQGLEDRLRSRFEGGMMMEIQPPEIETKIRIIEQKCRDNKINMEKDIINFLAENINENVRQIESIILKLSFHHSMTNQPFSIPMAKNVIKEIQKESNEEISLEKIIETIAKECNIKPSEIISKSRKTQIVQARHLVIYLTRTLSNIDSMSMLAQKLNMKDHSAISKAFTQITKKIEQDKDLKLLTQNLKAKIQSEKSL